MPDAITRDQELTETDSTPPRGVVAISLLKTWQGAGAEGLLYITADEQTAEQLGANLYSLAPDCPVMVLPRWDSLPYDLAGPSRKITGRRASVLRRLAAGLAQPLVIATAEAVLQRVPPRQIWRNATLRIAPDGLVSAREVAGFLEAAGYELCALVDQPGEAAVHAQTIDVFPAGALGPVRLELNEDRISGISSYDPATQRTSDAVSELVLNAASEFTASRSDALAPSDAGHWLCDRYPALETIWDYMPKAAMVTEPGTTERAKLWLDQVREGYESWNRLLRAGVDEAEVGAAPNPKQLYCELEEWQSRLRDAGTPTLAYPRYQRTPVFATEPNPTRRFQEFAGKQLGEGLRLVLAAAHPADPRAVSRRAEPAFVGTVKRVSDWKSVLKAGPAQAFAIEVDFDSGFILPEDGVVVIAALTCWAAALTIRGQWRCQPSTRSGRRPRHRFA